LYYSLKCEVKGVVSNNAAPLVSISYEVKTFRGRLREDINDPEFRTHFREERQALKLAMKITKLREKKGLSQKQLAFLMGTSQQAISRIESGEYEGFTLKTLETLAKATGTRIKIEFIAA
jgi:predicted XRE-type DNA-binding protein